MPILKLSFQLHNGKLFQLLRNFIIQKTASVNSKALIYKSNNCIANLLYSSKNNCIKSLHQI